MSDETETEKKRFTVALPITGVIYVEVEAKDEDDAINAALMEDLVDGEKWPEPEEWQVHRQIVEGNIFHGGMNEAYAEEIG